MQLKPQNSNSVLAKIVLKVSVGEKKKKKGFMLETRKKQFASGVNYFK